ncbi:hypothetical protein K493DRAFT_332579 [Basidiobolus meristosporus CBS 931.73]|uniref:Uncharacterized protein n=1 Tax=Basidiobolus meristosporus CBS 931.73 TaxID=1314790 RepID=A0A1Y1ZC01_9FUNG|nr:hypothetical protein K493DRAFT_332579 [Basidiobolus meristosporus CBS 931.73]|eukprot:ORY07833.1 hypothetical protein K493DRAFT_332579 [Basidiobolus meristosporus CBS 931.73]
MFVIILLLYMIYFPPNNKTITMEFDNQSYKVQTPDWRHSILVSFIVGTHLILSLSSVGALSIPMMLMQTPGAFLFAYSIYLRPGTNWTSWMTFVASGMLQGILLCMCIVWTVRADSRITVGTAIVHNPLDIRTERTALLHNKLVHPASGESTYS